MHGEMSSPSVEKQKRHVDALAASGAAAAATAPPPPLDGAPLLPKRSRYMEFLRLKPREAAASLWRSAALARSDPIASLSSYCTSGGVRR